MALRDMQTVIYTTDKGKQYRTKIDKSVFQQQDAAATGPLVGGADYTGAAWLDPMPVNLIPRHAVVRAAGSARRVILLEPDSPLEVGLAGDTTIDLQVLGEAAVTYTVDRVNPERWKRLPSAAD